MNEHHGSDYFARVREWIDADYRRRQQRARELAQAIEIITRQAVNDLATAQCPCCNGAGRVGIIIGAKDDQ